MTTPTEDADRRLGHGLGQPARAARRLRGRQGQGQEHEGGRDPIVEAALHAQKTADPRWHDRVGGHLLPEPRICRRQDSADEQRDTERDAREEQERGDCPERDRQRQPDDQQSRDGCRILAQGPGSDGGCVGEQEQCQRGLGEHLDRFGLGLERDRPKDVIGQKEADGQEGEGRSDRQSIEAGRDQRVAGDEHRQDRQLDLHESSAPALADGCRADHGIGRPVPGGPARTIRP